jgi:DNA-nicking Smr family endonuclease
MARRRTLRPEEEVLWHAVARTATPLHPKPDHVPVLNLPRSVVTEPVPRKPEPLPQFRVGEKARSPVTLPGPASISAIQMDRKAFDRLTRGKLAPEGRIDLHGMTVAEAHPELIRFILNSHAAGMRLVLVITGKGKSGPDVGPIPQRYGILKHQVPQWLRVAPLASVTMQVAEAHLKHGGAGAYYVYLRRSR